MRECEDVIFAGHANVSSEHAKFLAYNSQLEVVARTDKRISDFEDATKQAKKDKASRAKQSNATAQKVDSCFSKLGTIEIRLVRLEKK